MLIVELALTRSFSNFKTNEVLSRWSDTAASWRARDRAVASRASRLSVGLRVPN